MSAARWVKTGGGRVRVEQPYPGLRPFDADETHLFFGRDEQIDELLRRMQARRFLAVLGSSGSGKSSLLKAGLLPALEGGFLVGAGSAWRIATMRPGGSPIGNLARALEHAGVAPAVDRRLRRTFVESTLRRSGLGLAQAVEQAPLESDERVLLLVDQFEELFRFERETKNADRDDESAAFVTLLLEAVRRDRGPIHVVLTMRSDFLGDCSQHRELPEAVSKGLYLIPRMGRDQLREAIVGPAAVGGARIAAALVQRILNDVGDDPDQLPVLQHALMRTWNHHRVEGDDGEIGLEAYDSVGGLGGALSRHAGDTLAELEQAGLGRAARLVFQALAEKGPDNREIRRPTALATLWSIADAATDEDRAGVVRVVEAFRAEGRSFLMPPASESLGAESVIDISHESLIRQWGKLRVWVEEESTDRERYERVVDSALQHERQEGGLWRDPQLQLYTEWWEERQPTAAWAERYGGHLEKARRFLEAGRHERELLARKEDDDRRQKLRRARLAAAGSLIAFLVAVGLLVWAWKGQAASRALGRLATRLEDQVVSSRDPERMADKVLELMVFHRRTPARMVAMLPDSRLESHEYVSVFVLALDVAEQQARSDILRVRGELAKRLGGPAGHIDELLNARIRIEGGSFWMGSPEGEGEDDERPIREVVLSPFLMQEHEVTNEEYSRFDPEHRFAKGLESHPVVNVNWHDAMAYAAWLGGRLPTEAQWEFAARGASGREYPWGDSPPDCEKAQYSECPFGTSSAGSLEKGKSPEGIYDLAGNVWEWCRDSWKPYPVLPQNNPLGPSTGATRVLRGGSFYYGSEGLRAAFRTRNDPDSRSPTFGFRVVWSVPAEPG